MTGPQTVPADAGAWIVAIIGDPATPAWVQAVGSVLAIFAAGHLMVAQHRLERESEDARARIAQRDALLTFEAFALGVKARLDLMANVSVEGVGGISDYARLAALCASNAGEASTLTKLALRLPTACFTAPDQHTYWAGLLARLGRFEAHSTTWEKLAEEAHRIKMELPLAEMVAALEERRRIAADYAERAAAVFREAAASLDSKSAQQAREGGA